MGTLFDTLATFLLAFLCTAFLTPVCIWVVKKIGLIDIPSKELHKTHSHPIPYAGGLSLILSCAIVFTIFWDEWSSILNITFVLSLALIFFTGFVDDAVNLTASKKILAQIAVSMLLVSGGFHVNLFNYFPADAVISIIWLVGIINAFNFLDGSDGLAVGVSIIIGCFLLLFTGFSSQPVIQHITLVFIGMLFGLLIYNARPAKMFLGDSGAQVIGMILAVLAMAYNPIGFNKESSWITPIIMMAVPIFDVTLVVFSRVKRKVPIYRGGLDHTFHRLVKVGFSFQKANNLIFGLTIASNLVAFGLLYAKPILAYIVFSIVIIMGLGLLLILERLFFQNQNPPISQ